jgi:hypothetical protein
MGTEKKSNEKTSSTSTASGGVHSKGLQLWVYGVLTLMGVGILVILGWSFYKDASFLQRLGNTEYARGLITFVFTLGTIAIAIMLTLAVLLRQDPEIEKRFRQGREVLTILIGVVGTIVGFYFGAATVEELPPLEIAYVEIIPGDREASMNPEIRAKLIGGRPPYHYSIAFDSDKIPRIESDAKEKGLITKQVVIPENVAKKVKFTVTVTDTKNQKAEKKGEFLIPIMYQLNK